MGSNGTPTTAVDLAGVGRSYGKGDAAVAALDGVSLTVAGGEFVAVMGPSGSGKSTLLNVIGALDRPTSGTVSVGGREIGRLRPRDAARYRLREVGFVFQSFNLLHRQTVLENVATPLLFDQVPTKQRRERARAALARLDMEHRLDHRPASLSGGEQQRVAIARALVMSPSLLLADEPTGNLDSRNAETVMGLLRDLNATGQTILLITHDATVASHADRVVHMRDGRIVAGDTPG